MYRLTFFKQSFKEIPEKQNEIMPHKITGYNLYKIIVVKAVS